MMSMSSNAAAVADTSFLEAALFSVDAQVEPGVMPRVLELFAKRGLVPSAWRSVVTQKEQPRLIIEIQMSGLGRDITEYIAACLRQIASVEAVVTLFPDRAD
jgi:acetolactate synthase small subunit